MTYGAGKHCSAVVKPFERDGCDICRQPPETVTDSDADGAHPRWRGDCICPNNSRDHRRRTRGTGDVSSRSKNQRRTSPRNYGILVVFIFLTRINPRPTGGLFRAPPLVFVRYLLNRCRYHRQTCSTLSPNIFTHCVKILKSRVS